MIKEDIKNGLRKLGIEKGDDVFVTSSLSRFGHVEGGADTIVKAICELVGKEGTVIMPSFNFSIFKKNEIVLDLKNTPSEMGAITEAFRKTAHRTRNLFHPLAHKGKLSKAITKCDTYNTWGYNSPYALMATKNVKMVLLGTDFYSCPIFHFCEQRHRVPYREPIVYKGFVKDFWGNHPVKCKRLRRLYGDSDHNKVYKIYELKEVKIGKAICRTFEIGRMVKFCDKLLFENPYALMEDNGCSTQMPVMEPLPDMMTIIHELFKHKRHLVSDGFDDSLEYISNFIPLRIRTWKSGEKAWTWTIPKKEPQGTNGKLKVGEYTVKGFSDETVVLPIHLDHPYMANDNLSGVAVAMELIIKLSMLSDLKYSYKFLFVPETIGTTAYLSRYGTNYKYGIVFDSVGAGGELVATKTLTPSALNSYLTLPTNEFLSDEHLKYANDERALEAVGIPSVQFSRIPFKEYHTLDDTPSIIDEGMLVETLYYIVDLISRIEHDFVPIPTYSGIPCLSNYDLWKPVLRIEKIIYTIDGKRSIQEISDKIDAPFDYVYDFVIKMKAKGLVC